MPSNSTFIGLKLFWASPKLFGPEQSILDMGQKVNFSYEKSVVALSKIIWTDPKCFGSRSNLFWTHRGTGQ